MTRLLDIVLSSVSIVCLSPFLVPLMILLKCTGEGEIFYLQERVGLGGRSFGLLKFATMLKESPKIGAGDITVRNDPRILRLGRLLRKSKLNELPQLWNIFVGDMSVVGPRPMVPNTFRHYPTSAQTAICSVRPGLTGIGSIVFRDEERYLDGLSDPVDYYRRVIIPYKSEIEQWYVAHTSLRLYAKVIAVTAWVILFPDSRISQVMFKGLPAPPNDLDPAQK